MKKKIMICSIICISIITYFIISYDNEEIMQVSNIDNNLNDIAFYLQTEEGSEEYDSVDTIPSKDDGYVFKEAVCNDSSVVSFNNNSWSLNVSNMESGRVRCKLYFDVDTASARDYILSQNTVNEETPDFSTTATTDEGIFMAEDDYGTSYYWRGDVDNNYFYFAGYYWRIIRINGDGTIRLIYQGTSANATGDDANAFSSTWTNNQNNNAYIGYMYGSTSSSTYEGTHANTNNSVMKNNLDNWYDENLLDYSEYIADSGFCGDRSLYSGTGIGTSTSYYGAYGRLVNSKTPTFKCTNENDLYTTSSSEYGNKALTNPIGLITADEVSMAGGVSSGTSGSSNTSYYLYTGSNYKIFSPYGYFNDGGTVRAVLFGVDTNGVLRRFSNTSSAHGVRPVINLNKDVELEGTGISSDPFRIAGTERNMQEIIAGYNIGNRESFDNVYTTSTTNNIFTTTDWEGTSYYFAGAPLDNWVYFGGFYWRIVRINGNGTVRLIYNGVSTETTGTETMINNGDVYQFNSNYNQSEYASLKYTTGTQHGQNTNSPILEILQSWYSTSGLSAIENSQYIDTSVGFCSDRNMASGYSWSSQPDSDIYYAAYERLVTNKNPNLACSINDIIRIPVGLITADEVAFAGGKYGSFNSVNRNYYLYTGQEYWTMTPYRMQAVSGNRFAHVLNIGPNGMISWTTVLDTKSIRPVINLKSDTLFTGSGTASDPYVVVGAE